MALLQSFGRWFGFNWALGERRGLQYGEPGNALIEGLSSIGPDGALQLSAVWACIDRRATTIASLPFFAYRNSSGQRDLARTSTLYQLLHDSPNSRMTPFEFWRAMMMNHDLRGNAYARIERLDNGEAIALWPMPADQVQSYVLPDGRMTYEYVIESDVAVLAAENVLHLKNLGNGTTGLSKLDFMRVTTHEMTSAQASAAKLFTNGGKPTGVLMVDAVLNPDQREAIRNRFAEMQSGNRWRGCSCWKRT
jgi:HK97 family phage portal protein